MSSFSEKTCALAETSLERDFLSVYSRLDETISNCMILVRFHNPICNLHMLGGTTITDIITFAAWVADAGFWNIDSLLLLTSTVSSTGWVFCFCVSLGPIFIVSLQAQHSWLRQTSHFTYPQEIRQMNELCWWTVQLEVKNKIQKEKRETLIAVMISMNFFIKMSFHIIQVQTFATLSSILTDSVVAYL